MIEFCNSYTKFSIVVREIKSDMICFRPIEYDDACIIMQQLLDAVIAIHSKDIIHRNITPHNIVFKK